MTVVGSLKLLSMAASAIASAPLAPLGRLPETLKITSMPPRPEVLLIVVTP